jgi:transposase-like protein
MSRKCKVCSHPLKDDIDFRLVSGHAYRELSRQFGIDKSSLHRHKKNHISAKLIESQRFKEISSANLLVEQIQKLQIKAERIAKKAERKGDYRTALAGIRELTRIVELLGKLQGELHESNVNIVLNTKWVELRALILTVLDDYPEAKIKLAEAIQQNDCA